MKNPLYLVLLVLLGCSTSAVSPGMTFLVALNQYQQEIERLEERPERWPDRQAMAEGLRTRYMATIGRSREFDRLMDLDFRRREFLIALRDPSMKPERAVEIKQELAKINNDADALKRVIGAQIANAELRVPREQPQSLEAIAAIGLLTMGIDALSSARTPNYAFYPSTTVGQHIVTDHSSFSTVRTPEGRTYRCLTMLLSEAASIKCE